MKPQMFTVVTAHRIQCLCLSCPKYVNGYRGHQWLLLQSKGANLGNEPVPPLYS